MEVETTWFTFKGNRKVDRIYYWQIVEVRVMRYSKYSNLEFFVEVNREREFVGWLHKDGVIVLSPLIRQYFPKIEIPKHEDHPVKRELKTLEYLDSKNNFRNPSEGE